MKLIFFYLTDDRRHYTFSHFTKLLNKSIKKNDWTLLILTHSNDEQFYTEELKKTTINSKIMNVHPHDNYMQKVRLAVRFAEENNTPYLLKCDNDIFLTPQSLDYMIDNLSILDNNEYLTLGPTLSSGIPGIEYFMNQYLSESEQNILRNKFLKTNFFNRDGAEYTILNKHTIDSISWNSMDFFNSIKNLQHYYKGIHPIRMNYDAIDYLNTCILNNKEKFFNTLPSALILNDTSPYLCDSIFCIRTDVYKKIIYDNSLFVDSYDEVPLNKYAWKELMKHAFVENGFAIHILYNWYNNIHQYEHEFTEKLFS